jgi:hypothetical protein
MIRSGATTDKTFRNDSSLIFNMIFFTREVE